MRILDAKGNVLRSADPKIDASAETVQICETLKSSRSNLRAKSISGNISEHRSVSVSGQICLPQLSEGKRCEAGAPHAKRKDALRGRRYARKGVHESSEE
eukprot:TRINITY_DN2341_c0_g1_i1.p2 TRINITY_DN2341_c0_g1~~TRINITY_DN2341_c0_g1_i1.p2  ORF type:complete len:100 (+),score=5.48 TRINITY_DN2341_c0_g1_i1:279-578(+)